jgi:hypothetical protein
MFEFLRDSLTDSARIRLSVESESYQINEREDGPCYLKTLLIKFHVETNATNFHLRESLSLLPSRMKDLKSNVAKFNDHVSAIVVELAAGGETSSDLIVYVFRSYLSIEDQEFKRYIQNQKEKYDEGDPNVTVSTLMSKALTKYNQLIQSKTWKAKSPEEEKLIALTAQLKVAKDKINELSKKKKSNTGTTTKKEEGATNAQSTGAATRSRTNNPKYPDWRFERKGTDTVMEKDGKTYHWCENHGEKGMWTEHEPKACKSKRRKDKSNQGNSKNNEKGSQPMALNIAKALVAISEANGTESDDEES